MVLFLWMGAIFVLLVFYGCARKPCEPVWDIPTPVLQSEAAQTIADTSAELGDWPEENWWTFFQDPVLDGLIIQGIENNPRLKIAEARARLSLAQAGIVRGALFPRVFVEADVMRYRQSETGIFGIIPQQRALFPFSYTQPEFSLNFTFEIDWWGKHCNALQAALGLVKADCAEAYAARMILGVSIAQAYFQFQTTLARLELAKRLVSNEEETLQLVQQRVTNHLDSDIHIQNREQDLHAAREYVASLQQETKARLYALRALVAGQFDETIPPIELEDACYGAYPIPTTLPLDLVSHRPEIVAQLWRICAAALHVTIARKDFYPNLNLMGLIGQQTLISSTLFKKESQYGQIGPAIHLPIFEGGRLIANLNAKETEYEIAILEYEDLLIQAVHSVLQSLSDLQSWHTRVEENGKRVEALQKQYRYIQDRVQNNLNSKLDLLSTERNLLETRDIYIQTKAAYILSTVALIRSLGGGY